MMRLKLVAAFALASASMVIVPASAHHSFAMFDQTKIMTLEGRVVEFQWTNPHAWIEMSVAGQRSSKRWSIELNSPNNLKRRGWRRNSLKPGDRVKLRMSPLRDGKSGGLFLDVVLPNGKLLDSGLPKNGTPVNVPQL